MREEPTIRLTRQFTFEAAHALSDYDGACRNIHGHSYSLFVTVRGKPLNQPGHPRNGMLIDFSMLKEIVTSLITDKFDHALLVDASSEIGKACIKDKAFGKVIALPYQPTCENMVSDFASSLQKALPEGVELYSLKLHETASSYAEWYAGDQNRKL